MMNEQGLAQKFSAWLRELSKRRPVYYLKVHGHRHQRVGVADYWLVIDGKSVQIETKRPSMKPRGTKVQERELKKHAAAGGKSYVATSLAACKAVVLYHLGDADSPTLARHIHGEGDLRIVRKPR